MVGRVLCSVCMQSVIQKLKRPKPQNAGIQMHVKVAGYEPLYYVYPAHNGDEC